MAIGTVKFFNTDRGYGFITPEEGGQDVFVHISAVERAGVKKLEEGQSVEFELTYAPNGTPTADKVTLGGTHGSGDDPRG